MFLVAAQTFATALACYGLWRLLRIISGSGRIPALIVGLGFAARALLSVALFWVSYFRLPLGRSLQLGRGFWFYGVDAEYYFGYALETLSRGATAFLHVSPSYPARAFVQVIALAVQLFGPVPSVGILINCFTYLGLCLLIARLGTQDARITPVTTAALAAISFGPASILNSTQMLKDPLFHFLLVVALVVSLKWHDLWTSADAIGRRRVAGLFGCALLLLLCAYAIATIRWYFGILLLVSCAVLFFWQMITARQRVAAIVVNLAMLVLLARVAEAGGLDDIPDYLRDILRLRAAPRSIASLPKSVVSNVEDVRVGFELTPGATNIKPGGAVATPPPVEPLPPAVTSASVIDSGAATATVAEVTPKPTADITKPPAVPQETKPVETTTTIATTTIATTTIATTTIAPRPAPTTIAEPAPPPQTQTAIAQAAPVEKPKKPRVRKKPAVPAKPVVVAQKPPAPVATTPAVQPAPPSPNPVPRTPVASFGPTENVKQRFLSSVAATFVPRAIAQKLGWIQIGGGRGFWFFADIDTIAFDIVLLFALITCARQLLRSRGRMTPMFVQVVVLFMIAAVPLIYAIANFGTLFRHRQMIYLGLCLLPVALVHQQQRQQQKQEPPPEPAAM